ILFFFFSSRRRHTRSKRDWSSDVCSSDLYTTGASSGVPKITGPLTLTAGAIRSGALELSNVDLSNEFINLIIASTGFSAASRVITTSDQLLTELLNSSR